MTEESEHIVLLDGVLDKGQTVQVGLMNDGNVVLIHNTGGFIKLPYSYFLIAADKLREELARMGMVEGRITGIGIDPAPAPGTPS